MYVAGFSLNVLTLLALVLAIGLVVDDAIVVVEVIYAKIEAGRDPMTAGIEGTREIFFAVVATTVALVAVFMPILFLGRAGRATLSGVRCDPRRGGRHLLLRRADPDANALDPVLKKARAALAVPNVTEPFFAPSHRATARLTDMLRRRWLAVPIVLAVLRPGCPLSRGAAA